MPMPEELRKVAADAEDQVHGGNYLAGELIQGECIRAEDGVEAEIAAAVGEVWFNNAMSGPYFPKVLGRDVAYAIKAYRREMAKPDDAPDE